MPQGSWLGPLAFLILIDDLEVDCLLHKYVDDTTLTELLLGRSQLSNMQYFFQQLLNWSTANDMVVNFSKTKEMVMGPPSLSDLPLLTTDFGSIERVHSFKLLGVHLDANFLWSTHVDAIVSKASKRLYFLKQLKRAGVPHSQLLHFYLAVIRPVLEYAAPVWNHSLNKNQTDKIESIQRRALRIIYTFTTDMPYWGALQCAELSSLSNRRNELSRSLFNFIKSPDSCIHSLLPPQRDPSILSRLRHPSKFPRQPSRTKKYQSFISFALSHFQR